MDMRTKVAAAAAVAASMLGGAGLGAVLNVPGIAGAQDATPSTPTPPSPAEPKPSPQWMTDALKALVDNGTITQAQADSVAKALQDAKPARGPGGHGKGGHRGFIKAELSAAAAALGMPEAELKTALRSGQSVADVAKAKNVDLQKVIDAMVNQAKARLAEAVANGRITQAQADERAAKLAEGITAFVNRTPPVKGERSAPTPQSFGAF